MKEKKKKILSIFKSILIVILCLVIATETIAFVAVILFNGNKKTEETVQPVVELVVDASALSSEIGNIIYGITENTGSELSPQGISDMIKEVIYSDMIINMIMSMSYPLLYDVLTELEMMDFSANIDLYPTGPALASQISSSEYTCCDKDGTRKPLTEVLNNVGSDWSYMNTVISWTDTDGELKTSSLWNTIKWGATDKESFYQAMNDMSEGLRGVLEICIQGKSRIVNINVVEFLLHTDGLPINLDAATIYNASEKSGYETCLVSLFTSLGLNEGEYPSPSEVCAYTELSDIWKAILEPVLSAVDKTVQDPISGLTTLLINFAAIIEDGSLRENMRSMRMDADFHELASAVMGFKDGMLYNLGDSLIEIISGMGIDISDSFNNLLDGLLKLISKSDAADMPDMDISKLLSCGTATTLSSGSTYYIADSAKTVDFLIEYIINEKIIESVIALTPIKGTEEASIIVSAVGQSKEGLTTIAKTLVGILLEKLDEILV